MTAAPDLAPLLEGFFTQRLIAQRRASPHTIASYRDTFRLLLGFVQKHAGRAPSKLALIDLKAPLIASFLDELETERTNNARTRNLRLAAIRSFFRYAALEAPEHSALIQRVLAIPRKRHTRPLIDFLVRAEIEALLSVPDRETWIGQRDHAFLLVAVQTGLRLSELTGLRQQDVSIGTGAHVRCQGKGRKQRATPLPSDEANGCGRECVDQTPRPGQWLLSVPQRAEGDASVPMPLNVWSLATWRRRRSCVRLFPRNESRPMYFATMPISGLCRIAFQK